MPSGSLIERTSSAAFSASLAIPFSGRFPGALAHVLVTGDSANLLLFGSIGSLGLVGAPLLDAKKAKSREQWRAFSVATSSVPFLAIVEGRQRLVLREIGVWRLAVAAVVFVVLVLVHPWLFGASPTAGLW